MAAPLCTRAELIAAGACFRACILNPHLRKSLLVYFMIQELAAIGGTDYSAALDQLNVDSTDVFRDMGDDQRYASELAMFKQNAENAGATISDDINVLQDEIKCIKCYTPEQLERWFLFLLCNLGTHAAYPQ